tara:strand:- start:5474 stop:6358 length:885 start_codon:yes stop_codon:yes gene_type:complete
MANTIAGVNLATIAQESLQGLSTLFAPLSALTTDFSNDVRNAGESVTTRYPTKPTAADMSGGYKAAAADVAMTSATISLNTHYGFTYGFTDVERSKSSINLNDLFIQPALQALGDKVFGDIWNLVTAANFGTAEVITAANFDRDDLVDLGATLTSVKKAPQGGRSVFMNPSYYASLVKTLNSAEFPSMISDKIEARVPRVAKFDSFETDIADANAENLAAFAFQKNSLLMAGRTVDAEMAQNSGIEVETIVIPELGLPVQFRRWYDSEGILYYNCNLLYGVAKGVDYGVRVTTA